MSSAFPSTFRFAPSPNGLLHLGHAYSALVNQMICDQINGTLLVRLEDIDTNRCTPQLEKDMLDDLRWLGLQWEGAPLRQSEHFDDYQKALQTLIDAGLAYPSFMTRGEIKRAVNQKREDDESWKNDPDGTPLYPGREREWSKTRIEAQLKKSNRHVWRLNMAAAMERVGNNLFWHEMDPVADDQNRQIAAEPSAWGDVVLARSDTPTSYHLSVVVDDARQNITHVVRGRDLYHATAIHRLLQTLLELPAPIYHHHELILDADGRKLSKSANDVSIRSLRDNGCSPQDIKKMVGL